MIFKPIVALLLLIETGEAKFKFGTCPEVPKLPDFSYEKFAGEWYEVKRDKHHHMFSNQKCTKSTYEPHKKGKGMKLKRDY